MSVNPGRKNILIEEKFLPPVLPAFVFRSQKILKLNRFDFTPDAAGAAEIRNPGLGADPGAAEHDTFATGVKHRF